MKRKDKRSAKLSDNDIFRIKKLRSMGKTYVEISKMYKVWATTIRIACDKDARHKHHNLVVNINSNRANKNKIFKNKWYKQMNKARVKATKTNPELREYLRKKSNTYYKIRSKKR